MAGTGGQTFLVRRAGLPGRNRRESSLCQVRGERPVKYIGVDSGGTFTDVVVYDEESGGIQVAKLPSVPADPSMGFVHGIDAVDVPLAQVARVVQGTTVGTNGVIERKGSKTALVTTMGFRDLLEIGRGQRLTGGLFDPKFVRPSPLVPRPLRFELHERVDSTGAVYLPLDDEEVRELGMRLAGLGVESVAICLLHSYLNDSHERRAESLLKQALPWASISISSDILPEYREYERFSTTVFNAYLGPLIFRYFSRIQEELASRGYDDNLLVMTNNGGMVSAGVAAQYPVHTIASGPAAGVSAGLAIGEGAGLKDFITFDMGGTSTDVCLVKNLRASTSPMKLVGGLPLKTSQLDVNSIGAGAGSIAWVDTDGAFHVGPQSAGADPGPACYGRGGESATVTDANLVLQRLRPGTKLGGRLQVSQQLARQAVERLGDKLGIDDVCRVADGVVQVAVASMARAIREISVERGEDPRDVALIAFGGAGPLHACLVAEEVGIPLVVVPPFPGNTSAAGLLTSDVKHEFARTYLCVLQDIDIDRVVRLVKEMVKEGEAMLTRDAIPSDRMRFFYLADMRYAGQGHELRVSLNPDELTPEGMEERFHRAHMNRYAFSRAEGAIQLVTLRVMAVGKVSKLRFPSTQPRPTTREHRVPKKAHQAYYQGRFIPTRVYQRERLSLDEVLRGPAVVEEMGSTTVIFPGWTGQVDPVGNILLRTGDPG
jgi:N-methylhydantoinase A